SVFLLSAASIPDSTLAEYKTINAKKIYETFLNFELETKAAQDKLLCEMSFCHFEDKNNCVASCQKWGAEKNQTVFEDIIKQFSKATVVANEKECGARCQFVCQNEPCKDICSSLCSAHFSYPDRAEYEGEFNKFFGVVMEDSKKNGDYVRYSK
ncbi:hypothetical protein PFISCL1PPCAC_9700, partial [Pristionchus fissidentatus]